LTFAPFLSLLPGLGSSLKTRFLFRRVDGLYVTVPTRQCAFLILVFAVVRSCPST